jgi:hypothetical protein
MTATVRLAGAAAAALSLAAVVSAQSPLLDVKLGLWEITMKTNMGGAAAAQMPKMSDEDLAKLPPATRAQIENAMKAASGAPMTIKQCMTKEKLEKNALGAQQRANQNCTQTVTKNTKTVMEANVVCTNPASTGSVHMEATSTTSYQGTVHSKSTERGREMEVTMEMSGKWVGADCGDVK